MSGVAIEDLLELWSAELRKAKARLGWLIGHPSVVASAAAFLDTLLGPERRKTGWMRAEAAGDAGPWRQQAVLGRSHWDADALRDVVRDYALETLAEGDARAGHRRDRLSQAGQGVVRRWTAVHRLGGQDHQLPGRRLCRLCVRQGPRLHRPAALPAQGLDRQSGAPGGGPCARGCQVRDQAAARGRDDRAGDRRRGAVRLGGGGQCLRRRRRWKWRCAGPARDTCSVSRARTQFHSWDKPEPVSGTAEAIAAALPASRWVRLSAGAGTKGPRLYDWAYLELADLDAEPSSTVAPRRRCGHAAC